MRFLALEEISLCLCAVAAKEHSTWYMYFICKKIIKTFPILKLGEDGWRGED